MFSSLQLLNHTRWEVFCPLQSKMKFLVALLSATLVYGAANPGHDDHGHIEYQQHDGPHCHDKKDQQCHKIPKEQEHEECYVDYEIIVDVTYIEECQYVTKTYCHEEQESRYHHSRIVGHDSRVVDEYHADHYGQNDYHKRSADAGEYGYYSGPKCEDKKEQECHKHPHENSRKIPKTTCKKIVDTIYIEECEEIIHTVCEEAHQQYHHSQHVAGHESNVVAGSAGHHEEHHGESYGHGHGHQGGY
jgi:hypothetical protein